MADGLAQLLLGSAWGLLSPLLPCPLAAGWILQRDMLIPGAGGGYSAVAVESPLRRVWLLSDLPEGELSAWTLPSPQSAPRRLDTLQLQVP